MSLSVAQVSRRGAAATPSQFPLAAIDKVGVAGR